MIQSNDLNANLLYGNSTSGGTDIQTVDLTGAFTGTSTLQTEQADWEISFNAGTSALEIPSGAELTIAPGAVIKIGDAGGGCSHSFCDLLVYGTLTADG